MPQDTTEDPQNLTFEFLRRNQVTFNHQQLYWKKYNNEKKAQEFEKTIDLRYHQE